MPLGMEVGLSPGDIVLDGDPAPPKKGHFSDHVYCRQMVGCIKLPFGIKAELGPVHIVLDGDLAPPAPLQKGQSSLPLFGLCLLWPNGRPSERPSAELLLNFEAPIMSLEWLKLGT